MNLVDTIHCETDEFAEQMFDFYIKKGYSVMKSTVEINTGTKGNHVVKRLDILLKETVRPPKENRPKGEYHNG